jgi:hypothetical protein
MRTSRLIACLLVLLTAGTAWAHGVHTSVVAGAVTTVTVAHEDGAPMVGAAWTAMGPDGAVFASGVTDAGGQVSFLPDRPGAWRVRVASADGHGAVVNVDLTTANLTTAAAVVTDDHHDHPAAPAAAAPHADDHTHPTPAPGFRLTRAAAGFAALLGVLGIVYLVLRRRKA